MGPKKGPAKPAAKGSKDDGDKAAGKEKKGGNSVKVCFPVFHNGLGSFWRIFSNSFPCYRRISAC